MNELGRKVRGMDGSLSWVRPRMYRSSVSKANAALLPLRPLPPFLPLRPLPPVTSVVLVLVFVPVEVEVEGLVFDTSREEEVVDDGSRGAAGFRFRLSTVLLFEGLLSTTLLLSSPSVSLFFLSVVDVISTTPRSATFSFS